MTGLLTVSHVDLLAGFTVGESRPWNDYPAQEVCLSRSRCAEISAYSSCVPSCTFLIVSPLL